MPVFNADFEFLVRDFCGVDVFVGALPGAVDPDGAGDEDGEPPGRVFSIGCASSICSFVQ
jgi:hypothetical protein